MVITSSRHDLFTAGLKELGEMTSESETARTNDVKWSNNILWYMTV